MSQDDPFTPSIILHVSFCDLSKRERFSFGVGFERRKRKKVTVSKIYTISISLTLSYSQLYLNDLNSKFKGEICVTWNIYGIPSREKKYRWCRFDELGNTINRLLHLSFPTLVTCDIIFLSMWHACYHLCYFYYG